MSGLEYSGFVMKENIYMRGRKQLFRLVAQGSPVGLRIDQWLSESVSDLSRTEARKIIDMGGVHLNGRRVRTCSTQIHENDKVECHVDGYPLEPFRLADSDILYRDKYLLVLNKPAGVNTQPTPARYKGTLYEALLTLLGPVSGRKKTELGMVQRLDRGTSGLMVFSIHQHAHKGLSKIFLEHQVDKRYLALVKNRPDPPAAEICSMLARSRKYNKTVSVSHGGKNAVTRYRTRTANDKGALLEIELLTGRSHQIRAHMSEAGSALLGDSLYGGPMEADGAILHRPLLHAHRLAFEHPVTMEKLVFELPLPDDMRLLCNLMFGSED